MQQTQFLRQELKAESLPELLLLCSELADSTPLIFLIEQAQRDGLVLDSSLGHVLLQMSTSSLQKLLQLPGLVEPVKTAWYQASVAQLVSFSLLDRYLRRRASTVWRECLDQVTRETRQKLRAEDPPEVSLLLRLEGREQRRFHTEFPNLWQSWGEAWADTAQKAIRSLAARPRGVSLANAEKLLSQQVYTQLGHFLFELLQNADDAGASRFEVQFHPDKLVVSHDGVPFDFRDFVGVMSIGQTTKTEGQIGYFGVGFKSVFEVTDRPKIQSGHFSFEILDISVPRYLRPEKSVGRLTVLELPLKAGLTVDPYYQRALEIDATLLLNLPNTGSLHWIGPDGTETTLSSERDGSVFRLSRDLATSDYLVWRGHYKHQGERPEGKPKEAGVMLAFPIGGDHSIPSGNLFSFLPIQENSGLRFLLGSHFDVPVDRERLDQNSAWNRGILSVLPDIIGEHSEMWPEQLLSLLPLLPLPEDTVGPLFQPLSASLVERLKSIAFLRSARGDFQMAANAVVLEEGLLSLFGAEELTRFVVPKEERTKRWLDLLGAKTYDLKALLRDLLKGRVPAGLLTKDLQVWSHFHKLILQDPSFETWGRSLRTVPLLLDHKGEMAAAKDLLLLSPQWEQVFTARPRTVCPSLRELPETEALLVSLEIEHFDWPHLLSHLSQFGLEKVRKESLFSLLVEAPRGIQLTCLKLPLFPNEQGELRPLTWGGKGGDGLHVAGAGTPVELFSELQFCCDLEPLEALLSEMKWPYFDRSQGLAYLASKDWQAEPKEVELLSRWLLSEPSHWATIEDLERLSRLRIFKSRQGHLKTLNELWLVEDPELSALLSELPQLDDQGLSGELVDHFAMRHWLRQATLATLIDSFEEQDVPVVLPFLSERAEQLTFRQISELLSKPLYQGRSVAHPENPAKAACVEIAELDFVDVFRELGLKVAEREFAEQVTPLMKAAGYPLLGLQRLVTHLLSTKPPAELLPTLQGLLQSKAFDLDLAYSERVLQSLPLWLCQDGEVRAIKDIPADSDIRELLELQGHELVSPRPESLQELIPSVSASDFLRNRLKEEAFPGVVLGAQATWLRTVEQVDRVASLLSNCYLCVNAGLQLCDRRLSFAPPESHPWLSLSENVEDLLHPSSSPWQVGRAIHLSHREVLEAFLPFLEEESLRLSFYTYLENQLSHIVRDPWTRETLVKMELWRSAVGTFLPLDKLVLEGGLVDTGYDWFPHSEIPQSLLEQLKLAFDLGHSDSATVFRNLLRAYLTALEQRRDSLSLLAALGKVAENMTTGDVKWALQESLGGESFPLWDEESKSLRSVFSSYAPPSSLAPLKALPPAKAEWVAFLRKMGLPYYPGPSLLQALEEISPEDSKALEDLLAWAWEERPDELDQDLSTLKTIPWLLNRAGQLKAPVQLYLPSSEMEDLIGASPALYPASQRSQGFWRALGLRTLKDLSFPPVMVNLQRQISAGKVLGSHFYHFLESSLAQGKLNPLFLKTSLEGINWIWTDEGEHREAKEVLGFPAYRYFGTHRGTWERAHQRFPHLSRIFDIPEKLSTRTVLDFLQQVNDGEVSECSHRLLKNGLAYLAEKQVSLPRHWAVLPARQFPDLEEALVAADTPGVVRSNSPTLAAMFGQGGTLWVVETDDPEHGESMRALCRTLAIPDLREAYTVSPDASGVDLTEQMGECLASFRQLLRAVDKVLPRLRAARPEWSEGEWMVETRLRPFATTAPIRVVEPLELIYSLGKVSTVRVRTALAFDPQGQRLLLSSQAAREPQVFALELAEGLAECIYQGSGSDNLVDLLNLLLLFGSQERMNAYLDQRHFPRPFVESGQGSEPWRRRLGEILDFGLHHALTRRFPELEGLNWEAWRDPQWQALDGGAEEILARLGLSEASDELLQALQEMLEGPTLRLPSTEEPPGQVSPQGLEEALEVGFQESSPSSETPAPKVSRLSRFSKQLFSKLADILATGSSGNRALRLENDSLDLGDSYQDPPGRHLLVSSQGLSGHNLYCLDCLYSEFHAPSQEYRPAWGQWDSIFLPTGETVEFSGLPTSSEVPLPLPLYSKLLRAPRMEGMNLQGPDHFSQYHLNLPEGSNRISYQVELSGAPDFQNFHSLPDEETAGLLSPTTKLEELPVALLHWIEWACHCGLPHWQLAEQATQFVIDNYSYDLQHSDSEAVRAVIDTPLRDGENRFLSLLHAGRGGGKLGRGTCLGLSAVLLEILRHSGVPSAIGSVWMLDQGLIHLPDHAVALVLLPSSAGPYWLPLETSKARFLPESPAEEPRLTRLQLLEKAASLLLDQSMKFPHSSQKRQHLLEEILGNLFGNSELLELFLECLAKPGRYRKKLSPGFLELRERGFLEIQSEELYKVWVRED